MGGGVINEKGVDIYPHSPSNFSSDVLNQIKMFFELVKGFFQVLCKFLSIIVDTSLLSDSFPGIL